MNLRKAYLAQRKHQRTCYRATASGFTPFKGTPVPPGYGAVPDMTTRSEWDNHAYQIGLPEFLSLTQEAASYLMTGLVPPALGTSWRAVSSSLRRFGEGKA